CSARVIIVCISGAGQMSPCGKPGKCLRVRKRRLLIPIEGTSDIVPGTTSFGHEPQLFDKRLVGGMVEVERGIARIATIVIRAARYVVLLRGRQVDYVIVSVVVVRARGRQRGETDIERDGHRAYIQRAIERLLRYQLTGGVQRTTDRIPGSVVECNILPGKSS